MHNYTFPYYYIEQPSIQATPSGISNCALNPSKTSFLVSVSVIVRLTSVFGLSSSVKSEQSNNPYLNATYDIS